MQAPSVPAAPDLRAGYASLVTAVLGTSLSALFYKLSFATGLHPLWVNVLRMALTLVLMLPLMLFSRARRQGNISCPMTLLKPMPAACGGRRSAY